MHHPTEWHDRIEAEDGAIIRIVNAEWLDKRHGKWYSVDVYKENDMGDAWEQNLYHSMYGGHVVMFPGLPRCAQQNSYWYDETIAQEEGWTGRGCYKTVLSTVGTSDKVTETEKELVCSFYPDFKYVLKKYNVINKRDLMEKLRMWIPHHEVELILAAGFEKIAMSKSFFKLSEKNQKECCLFMRQNPQFKDLSLRELREAMRADNPQDYAKYLLAVPRFYRVRSSRGYFSTYISYQDYKYLKKQTGKYESGWKNDRKRHFASLLSFYSDYVYMLHRSGHNEKDAYWKYPNCLKEFHDRLVEEERIKREAEELARAKKEAEKIKAQQRILKALKKKFKDIPQNIDGYSIFVSTDYKEWERQADALNQCIVASGYYQGMADGNYTIVFIQKDGEPQATAQVMPNGEIHQFYANELDRNNCLPSEEIRTAFNKWLELVPKTKFRKYKRKAA